MNQIILLTIFCCSLHNASPLEYDKHQVYFQSVDLAVEYRCTSPNDLATAVVNCLNNFTDYSTMLNLDHLSVCDFNRIAGPYDMLSVCIKDSSDFFNCHDRFMLFDQVFRNVAHPAIFERCTRTETEKADWSTTFIAGTLAVLSSTSSAVISLLVYCFSS